MVDDPAAGDLWIAADCEGCVLNVVGRRQCCQDDLAAGHFRAFHRLFYGPRRPRKARRDDDPGEAVLEN